MVNVPLLCAVEQLHRVIADKIYPLGRCNGTAHIDTVNAAGTVLGVGAALFIAEVVNAVVLGVEHEIPSAAAVEPIYPRTYRGHSQPRNIVILFVVFGRAAVLKAKVCGIVYKGSLFFLFTV